MPFGNPYIPGKRPLSSSGTRQPSNNNNNKDAAPLRPKSAVPASRSSSELQSEGKTNNINDQHLSTLSDHTIDQISNNRFIAEKLFIHHTSTGTTASVTASTTETLSKLSFAEKLQVMIMQMSTGAAGTDEK